MRIDIFRGKTSLECGYDIAIIIDVIRAFTVTHYCFLQGARYIYLVSTVTEALALKDKHPDWLLMGEEGGYPISGFDLDNSPANPRLASVKNNILVQRTSNGVQATLLALAVTQVLVTGFSNALATAAYVRQIAKQASTQRIAVVASDAYSDDDLACAEYIAGLLSSAFPAITADQCCDRILASRAAQKFFDISKPEFELEQLRICSRENPSNFVMLLDKSASPPCIKTKPLKPDWKLSYVPRTETAILNSI